MKSIACALAAPLLLLSATAPALAQDDGSASFSETTQLAREIVDNGFPEEMRMDLFSGVMQQLVSQMNVAQPQLAQDPEIQELVLRYQQRAIDLGMATLEGHMDAMMEGLALAYADIYTLDELTAFHAFITSPEGYGFLAKSSAATAHPAFADANQAYINEYVAQLPQLQGELRDELTQILSSREDEPGSS